MKKVVVHIAETKDFSAEVIAQLGSFATVIEKDITAEEVKSALAACDVFWFRLGFRISSDCLDKTTRCKIIVCPVTGLDHIDLEACEHAGIEVLSLKGEVDFLKSVRATAELTLALTLALMRRVPLAVQSTVQGRWNRDDFKGTEILDKNVGIVGVGRLGSIVAGYFKTFGATVMGFDKQLINPSVCAPVKNIEELLSTADIVSIHLSYQRETHHFMNDQLFSCMKQGSVLINTARGGIVDSQALVRALATGRIAGAALDVIEDEFASSQNLLIEYALQHTNLIITPHIGGNTVESFRKTELFMVEKLKQKLHVTR